MVYFSSNKQIPNKICQRLRDNTLPLKVIAFPQLTRVTGSKEFLLNKTYEPKGLQQSVCLSFTTFNPYQLCSQMWGWPWTTERETRGVPRQASLLRVPHRPRDSADKAGIWDPRRLRSPWPHRLAVKRDDVTEDTRPESRTVASRPAPLPARPMDAAFCLPSSPPSSPDFVLACMTGNVLEISLSLKFKTNRLQGVCSGHAGSRFHHPREVLTIFSCAC